jgi:SAM-dependent methyltransferase
MELVEFKGNKYPKFQSVGYAAQFAIPYAKHVCKGQGVDVGCNRIEWAFPGSIVVDPIINGYDALNFPEYAVDLDYVFSSHCLEHVQDWVSVLDYWKTKLKSGGTLFLYLPDYSQVYWRPWNNRKHINIFNPTILKDYLEDRDFINIFNSGVDLNNAFMIMAQKQ